VKMLGAFIRHEWRTQMRSSRFALLSTVYALVSVFPLIVPCFVATRGFYLVGGAGFAESLLLLQPLATSLFASIMCVDALTREIDDGSFAVTSINGMTNGAWVASRWVALMLLVTGISIVPQIAGWGVAQYFHAGSSFVPFILRWLIFVVPTAVVVSALALGMGTITGRILVAAIVTIIMTIVLLSFGNDALAHFHETLDGPWEFLGFRIDPWNEASWIARGFNVNAHFGTDAGFDVSEAIDDALAGAALPAGISVVALACASGFLRRTRRDLRPRPVRGDHPLRTYLRMINRVREELAPEPKPSALDLAAIAMSLVCLVLAVTFVTRRARHYEALAAQRFAAESTTAPAPMAPSLHPLVLSVEATLDPDGRLQSSSELTIRNDGAGPQRLLSFQLNHALRVDRVSVSSGRIRTRRLWDRIAAELTPPIGAGESRSIHFSVEGRPALEEFNLHGRGSFSVQYRHYRRATSAVDLSDLSRSSTTLLITPIRVDLTGADLTPVPRYTPWTLAPATDDPQNLVVVPEGIRPPTDLRMSIRTMRGSVIADSCGSIGRGGERMRSRCTFSLASYRLSGGRLDLVASGDGSTFAVIAAHRPPATGYAPALAASVVVARRAWPGLMLSPHLVFLERPIRASDAWLRKQRSWQDPERIESSGALHMIDEFAFRVRRSPRSVPIAADLISQFLSARRPVAPSEQPFVTTFFRAVAVRRLGVGTRGSAVISGFGFPDTRPLLHAQFFGVTERMEGVLAYLEYLAGSDRLVAGINEFLRTDHVDAGNARELFRDIEESSQIPLARFYSDFVEGDALPVLALKDVVFRRAGSGWVVSGRVENRGSGQLFCPVVLRTEFQSARTIVPIDSHQSMPFSFSTPYRPRTLQLDPDRVCYRQAAIGTLDSIEYTGAS
jgi:hypothetical protein